jgi:hypothetical protein
MFDHVSASPAILQLMLRQYDWYEARSSVRERKLWPDRKFEVNKEHYTRERSCYLIYWIALLNTQYGQTAEILDVKPVVHEVTTVI